MSPESRKEKALPEEYGKPLEDSLTHLVENGANLQAHNADPQIAGKCSLYTPTPRVAVAEVKDTKAHPVDAVHSHSSWGRQWIASFFPSTETLDEVSYCSVIMLSRSLGGVLTAAICI